MLSNFNVFDTLTLLVWHREENLTYKSLRDVVWCYGYLSGARYR